jgi:hypoxanthine-guanine phosphoribosyltransferase
MAKDTRLTVFRISSKVFLWTLFIPKGRNLQIMEEIEWWREAIRSAKSIQDIERVFRRLWPVLFPKPVRNPLFDFPDVIIHASETSVKKHLVYPDAKAGSVESASELVKDNFNADAVETLKVRLQGRKPVIISAHALEGEGVNVIPETFAMMLAEKLGLEVESGIVQINTVSHTGSDGFGRLSRQPAFDGDVIKGKEYFIVDDFIGMGGTIANLRGYVESKGGIVIGATALTGKPYSSKLAPDRNTLQDLRDKHGKELEDWWEKRFNHTFDSLTQSEARYLLKTENADRIRNKIIEAEQI